MTVDADHGFALSVYVSALCSMFQQVDQVASDTDAGPGWSQIVDLNRCPSYGLGWLAQFVGVSLDPSLSDTAQRERIRNTDGWKRGTPNAIISAFQQYLTGTKHVTLRERAGGNAWHVIVVTKTSETPDAPKALAAGLAQKPGGLVLTHNVVPGQDYQGVLDDNATYADLLANFATYEDVIYNS